ncbi:unnamed protein product [Linum trigynum]|uniref:Uncharacterized protein n=1 Tax=Linum trigynum TaxID=586398 RepID=A0AAV2G5G8_9ROSI
MNPDGAGRSSPLDPCPDTRHPQILFSGSPYILNLHSESRCVGRSFSYSPEADSHSIWIVITFRVLVACCC